MDNPAGSAIAGRKRLARNKLRLLTHRRDSDGYGSVLPAQSGIQDLQAKASGDTSWIPGLALLARNDVCTSTYPSRSLRWRTTSKEATRLPLSFAYACATLRMYSNSNAHGGNR